MCLSWSSAEGGSGQAPVSAPAAHLGHITSPTHAHRMKEFSPHFSEKETEGQRGDLPGSHSLQLPCDSKATSPYPQARIRPALRDGCEPVGSSVRCDFPGLFLISRAGRVQMSAPRWPQETGVEDPEVCGRGTLWVLLFLRTFQTLGFVLECFGVYCLSLNIFICECKLLKN